MDPTETYHMYMVFSSLCSYLYLVFTVQKITHESSSLDHMSQDILQVIKELSRKNLGMRITMLVYGVNVQFLSLILREWTNCG